MKFRMPQFLHNVSAYQTIEGLSQAQALRKFLEDDAGERARLYFNKLKCNEVDGSLRIAALLFEYPSAVLCGESVLHAAGWITQIPTCLSVDVISRPSYVSLHGFDIRGRPLSWFKRIHFTVDSSPDKRIYGLRTLPTPLALADLYGDPKGWHPDVDDLDIPQEDLASVGAAATLLGVELPTPLGRKIKKAAKTFDRLEIADRSITFET
jgi:hypothetical protein